MPTVFVVQDPHDKNILPAAEHGKIKVLLFRHDLDRGTEHCIDVLSEHLRFMKDEDMLLPIGDPIMIGIAMHIAITTGEGEVNILRWIKEEYRYNPEKIRI